MQFRRSVGLGVLVSVLLLAGLVLSVLLWRHPESLGIASGSARQTLWLSVSSVTTLVVMVFLGGYQLFGRWIGSASYQPFESDDVPQPGQMPSANSTGAQDKQWSDRIRASLRARHGPFWRQKSASC